MEKPDVVTAARYLADGDYLWNSGIFVFRADVILEEIRKAMPVLGEQLEAIGRALGTPSYKKVLARVFPECPSISIDYGVMEKSHRIAVVPADFGWSDVGSFAALPEVREQDLLGNVVEGDGLVVDGRNNVVVGDRGAAGGRGRARRRGGRGRRRRHPGGGAGAGAGRRRAVEELARRGREEVL